MSAANGADRGEAGLTPKMEAAALATAAGASVPEAARAAGVGERTLKTWRAQAAFCARVAELRAHLTGQTLGKLVAASTRAADVLALLPEVDAPSVRLRAACSILDLALRTREQVELGQRLEAIEKAVAAGKGRGRW